tara:strand:+ start:539 stop:931 length:393 start_codon:yes stop_codon:yes gene_type:complete
MHIFRVLITSTVCFIAATDVFASLDLSSTLNCSYQRGQILDKDSAENVHNSTPLNWTFNNLNTKSGMFMAGGDSGEVMALPVFGGMAIYIPDKAGSHSFTIWSTGESIWNKQNNLLGTVYSQQYFGSCIN